MTLTNHAAAAYLHGDRSDSAKLARANLKIGMLESGVRELQHLLAGPDPKGDLIALEVEIWGATVTLHVSYDRENGLVWHECWASVANLTEWLHAVDADVVEAAMQAAWAARQRDEADDYAEAA